MGVTIKVELPTGYWDAPFGQEPVVGFRLAVQPKIEHNGATLDALDVATDAMQQWESFIK